MMKPAPLPAALGRQFSVNSANSLGLSRGRLRASDLETPFYGVRMVRHAHGGNHDRFAAARHRELELIRALGTRLVDGQFLSHRSAAQLWGAPLPHNDRTELHVGVDSTKRTPRIHGVVGHRISRERVQLLQLHGLTVTSPALTFMTLASLPLLDLVAVGDYFVRVYRPGVGRREVGKSPFVTIDELVTLERRFQWRGAPRLREALTLLREDSWSPKESMTRVLLRQARLPEPELNVDLFDEAGRFLGCVDMVWRRYKVVLEYQGEGHRDRFAEDLERIERLRANGWIVIQVSRVLFRRPEEMTFRVAAALKSRGWVDA